MYLRLILWYTISNIFWEATCSSIRVFVLRPRHWTSQCLYLWIESFWSPCHYSFYEVDMYICLYLIDKRSLTSRFLQFFYVLFQKDIRLRDEALHGTKKLHKKMVELQSHISYRIRYSLRVTCQVWTFFF